MICQLYSSPRPSFGRPDDAEVHASMKRPADLASCRRHARSLVVPPQRCRSEVRGSGSHRRARAALCFSVIAILPGVAALAVETLPLRNVDGVLCVRVELSTEAAEVPAYLTVDLGTRAPMLLHTRTAALLGVAGRGPVTVRTDDSGVTLSHLDAVVRELEPLEEITRRHAAELGEIPVCGVLGLPAFADRVVELDVQGDRLNLLLPREAADRQAGGSTGHYSAPFTAEAYGYWLAGQVGDAVVRIRLATSEQDTRVNLQTAKALGCVDGALPALRIGDLDIVKYTLLRPSDLSQFPAPVPDVILGTGLLRHVVVQVDLRNSRIDFWAGKVPELSAVERAFFSAQAAADADALEGLLRAHPDFRLAEEAAEELVTLRSAVSAVDREALQRALAAYAQSVPAKMRAMHLVRSADAYIAEEDERSDALDLALLALDAAQPFAADDPDAAAIHQINARRGLVALLRKDYATAQRFLLSAAFGLPKDPYVNLWLARLYEVKGQSARAWSRYLESALHDEPPIGAFRGLDRLNNDSAFRATFTMENAADLLEGRVSVFQPVGSADAPPAGDRGPLLLELFSSGAVEETQAAELAFDALARDAANGRILVQYHLDDGLSCAGARRRAEVYGIERVPTAVFAGGERVTLGGDDGAAAQVYAAYRSAEAKWALRDGAVTLRGSAGIRNGQVQADLRMEPAGLSADLALHLLLCERSVMALAENKQALHTWVVRAEVAPDGGWQESGAYRVTLALADVQTQLTEHWTQLETAAGHPLLMKAQYVDPAALALVAFLQDRRTNEVVAAVRIPVIASDSAP